jgi:hypothetical protein
VILIAIEELEVITITQTELGVISSTIEELSEIAITADTAVIIQGTDQKYRFTFTDASGCIDLTASTIYYRWKKYQDDANPAEILKSSSIVTEIEILPQAGATLGQADVFIDPTDTASLPTGWHYWDIWAVLASSKRYAKMPQRVSLVDAVTDL